MIIECLNCNKKFNVDAELIPDNGRLIQCGSCNHSWHYKIEKSSPQPLKIDPSNNQNKPQFEDTQIIRDNENLVNEKVFKTNNINTNKEINDVKKNINVDKKDEKNSLINFFSYLLVFVISFIALIILLDTLKSPLINIFPQLEIFLFNLFESLKDIKLFIIDLA
jgi:predicted Zn finger-like uncharacterized protein